jgi:hypothetical protein
MLCPGIHLRRPIIGWGRAASVVGLDLLWQRLPWTPDDLVALHRYVGPVTLPDICNGYFFTVTPRRSASDGAARPQLSAPLARNLPDHPACQQIMTVFTAAKSRLSFSTRRRRVGAGVGAAALVRLAVPGAVPRKG